MEGRKPQSHLVLVNSNIFDHLVYTNIQLGMMENDEFLIENFLPTRNFFSDTIPSPTRMLDPWNRVLGTGSFSCDDVCENIHDDDDDGGHDDSYGVRGMM